ncbi:MAG: cysteine--tRNA ligase [Gammaproteobacteria bacterium]|nr:cysteine--tRNA ligase [Gammaproteobacteria bacterium]
MHQLYLHNTLSGRKELFKPLDEHRVTVYVCGPTVYNYVHIGNGRPGVVFDVLVRLLRKLYPRVIYARNITDIDDKINAAALANRESIQALADRYTQAYNTDMAYLGVTEPDITPRATHHITEMIDMISQLIDNGHAYANDGHVMFDVPSDPHYGSLSGRSLQDMIDGARVEIAPYKKDPKDFVLWKPSTAEQPGWESPWGIGRPGWHIECSAMIRKHLGRTIDIHGGGSDLTFPHHENEAAQSRCANHSTEYVRYWIHNNMLTMGQEKMSKSVGNVQTINALAKQYSGEVLRYALLSGQYRSSLAWSQDLVAQAQASLASLYQALRDKPATLDEPLDFSQTSIEAFPKTVVSPLLDDLNTPEALAAMHELAAELQKAVNPEAVKRARTALRAGGWLLGLLNTDPDAYFTAGGSQSLSNSEIDDLIEARNIARQNKDFARGDQIRDLLAAAGIELEDLREGTRWRRS